MPEAQRIRVLAGDPPIDWTELKSAEEYKRFQEQREAFFAQVVIEQVLDRGERALLISGVGHLIRTNPWPGSSHVISAIEGRFPKSTFVIHPLTGWGAPVQEIEPLLVRWPVPSISPTRDTWLGQFDASFGIGIVKVEAGPKVGQEEASSKLVENPLASQPIPLSGDEGHSSADRVGAGEGKGIVKAIPLGEGPEGTTVEETVLFEGEGVVKQDIADALLYLGPQRLHTLSRVPDALYEDDAYWEELNRRSEIVFGEPVDPQIRLNHAIGRGH